MLCRRCSCGPGRRDAGRYGAYRCAPGGMLRAHEAGADMIKVFPATSLGPGYLKDVRGPLPQLKLVPTGGVTADNVGDWIRAGAAAVGMGGALVTPALVEKKDFAAIARRAADVLAAVKTARQSG